MSRLFVAVLEGDSPQTARTLVATEDRRVVNLVAEELQRRMTPQRIPTARRNPAITPGGDQNAAR